MSESIDHVQTKHHSLRDWLNLHELDRETCFHIIDEISREVAEISAPRTEWKEGYHAPDPDSTWAITIAAMHDFLPDCQSVIDETFQGSEKIAVVRSKASRKALTIDHGPSRFPTILYSINGDQSDQLVVAHEFGHALQIRASIGKFVPPVMREVCAFLAEGALLSYSGQNSSIQYEAIFAQWQDDNRKYFGRLTDKLKTALKNADEQYRYGWNYPIARLIALRIPIVCSREAIWDVFRGKWSVQSALDALRLQPISTGSRSS